MPLFVIKRKVHPCLEHSSFVHSRYDKSEVVGCVLLAHVKYASVSSLVVTSHGKNFGGKMVIRDACHFSDEFFVVSRSVFRCWVY